MIAYRTNAAPLAPRAEPVEGDLLTAIIAACQRKQIAPTTFGAMAVGDKNLVHNLRTGQRALRPATEAQVRAYLHRLQP